MALTYQDIRQRALLQDQVIPEMFPYFFKYYKSKLGEKMIVKSEEDFVAYFKMYLDTPVFDEFGQLQPMHNRDALIRKYPIIFAYLDSINNPQ